MIPRYIGSGSSEGLERPRHYGEGHHLEAVQQQQQQHPPVTSPGDQPLETVLDDDKEEELEQLSEAASRLANRSRLRLFFQSPISH